MCEDTKYSGWKNRETWLVNLWFGNEKGSWSWWNEQAREIVSNVFETWEPEYGWQTRENEAGSRLAEEMKEQVEDIAYETLGEAGLLYDLLSGAIGWVDWLEVAENWLEEIEKPDGW